MNWLKKAPIFKLGLGLTALAFAGCGVKGDPLPPEKPPELGRGRPTYKRATEEIRIEKTRPLHKKGNLKGDEGRDDDDKE